MSNIDKSYIIQKFYQLAGGVKANSSQGTYYGSCPVCREGKSWLKKKRLFLLDCSRVFCHNCGYSNSAINFIQDYGCISMDEIREESSGYISLNETSVQVKNTQSLPYDSFNLFSKYHIDYYKNNKEVKRALKYIKSRRLDTAINSPKALYFSLKDNIHKNRLILPYYDEDNNIIHYQSRLLDGDEGIRYISKVNSKKSVFGINNISDKIEHIFIFEGPIDSFFIENGVALGGITPKNLFSELQQQQINSLKHRGFDSFIFVLDNQFIDETSMKLSKYIALNTDFKVFVWPYYSQYKDFNKCATVFNLDKFNSQMVASRSYEREELMRMLTSKPSSTY